VSREVRSQKFNDATASGRVSRSDTPPCVRFRTDPCCTACPESRNTLSKRRALPAATRICRGPHCCELHRGILRGTRSFPRLAEGYRRRLWAAPVAGEEKTTPLSCSASWSRLEQEHGASRTTRVKEKAKSVTIRRPWRQCGTSLAPSHGGLGASRCIQYSSTVRRASAAGRDQTACVSVRPPGACPGASAVAHFKFLAVPRRPPAVYITI
jgi:hypothetical protein